MCEHCGCNQRSGVVRIRLERRITEENDKIAAENRRFFEENGILAINLIGSPGSGKTTLIEKTLELVGNAYRVAVLEGDIETTLDAERVRTKGAFAVQLTTGGACHLDALLVHKGIQAIREAFSEPPDLVFIENVGNLVCPASFDLGETLRVVLVSVPEGEDKPLKYPKAFLSSQLFLITKIDLAEVFGFSVERVEENALSVNPRLSVIPLSAKTGEGFDKWIEFLKARIGK